MMLPTGYFCDLIGHFQPYCSKGIKLLVYKRFSSTKESPTEVIYIGSPSQACAWARRHGARTPRSPHLSSSPPKPSSPTRSFYTPLIDLSAGTSPNRASDTTKRRSSLNRLWNYLMI